MQNKLILFPNVDEPQPGEIFQAKDGRWYLCVLGTDCCDCDIDCKDSIDCEYKPICHCFKRKKFGSVVFRSIRNLPDVAKFITNASKENTTGGGQEQFSTDFVRRGVLPSELLERPTRRDNDSSEN